MLKRYKFELYSHSPWYQTNKCLTIFWYTIQEWTTVCKAAIQNRTFNGVLNRGLKIKWALITQQDVQCPGCSGDIGIALRALPTTNSTSRGWRRVTGRFKRIFVSGKYCGWAEDGGDGHLCHGPLSRDALQPRKRTCVQQIESSNWF